MKTNNYEFETWKKIIRKKFAIYNMEIIVGIALMFISIFFFNVKHPAFFLDLQDKDQISTIDGIIKCATGVTIFISPFIILLGPWQKRKVRRNELFNIEREIKKTEEKIKENEETINVYAKDEADLGTKINICRQKKEDYTKDEEAHKTIASKRNSLQASVAKKNEHLEGLVLKLNYLQMKLSFKKQAIV